VSLFKTAEAEASYRAAYDASLQLWPARHESVNIPTRFGLTHVLACGPTDGQPVLLLPAMAFSATMWYATIPALSNEFRCYALDFPSDMGLSTQTNPPANRLDCVAWLGELLDWLGVVMVSFVGASYGSFLALNYAIAEPARVKKVALSSPAGGIIALRKAFYARLFFSMLVPGRSAAKRIMHWLFADRVRSSSIGQCCGPATARGNQNSKTPDEGLPRSFRRLRTGQNPRAPVSALWRKRSALQPLLR
jgi:pimeloyl-ACP methyl ester carboxylesterase